MGLMHRGTPLRVAVVGSGRLSELHHRILVSLPHVEPVPHTGDGFPAGVDAVSICVPALERPARLAKAFELGLPVLCPPPLAAAPPAARELAGAAPEGGLMLALPTARSARVTRLAGRLSRVVGDVAAATVAIVGEREWHPSRLSRSADGGGAGMQLLPEPLAVLAELISPTVRPAQASAITLPRLSTTGDDVEEALIGSFGYPRDRGGRAMPGAHVSVDASWRLGSGSSSRWTVQVVGTGGRVTITERITSERLRVDHTATMRRFLACVRGQSPWPATELELALWLQRVIGALYMSAHNRGGPARVG